MSSISKVVKGALLNLGGLGLPMVVAFFSIPYLIELLGAEKFGLLALIWAVVSYAGIFDLGLGRALTQQIAAHDAMGAHQKLGGLIGTAYGLMLLVSVGLGLLMFLLSTSIVGVVKGVTNIEETEAAFHVMAASVPFIILASGFRGVLEARQAFGQVNYVRLPLGIYTFVGPVVVACLFGARLDLIAVALVLGRVMACVAYLWFVVKSAAIEEHRTLAWESKHVKSLCASGGWLSVASVVGPVMGYADRFVLGGIISATAVAYYVTPNELVTKLWILPGALTAVLFPLFSSDLSGAGRSATVRLFDFSSMIIYSMIAPLSLILAVFSYEVLKLWVGAEFAVEGQAILVIFAFAILINCMAHVPLTLLQGGGDARLVALLQVVEIPMFLLVLWWLTLKFGVLGAASAWVLRAVFDTILMLYLACRKLNVSFARRAGLALLGVIALLGCYLLIRDAAVTVRLLIVGVICAAFALVIVWWTAKSMKFKLKMQS
ncbi:flippase [Pseudomonas entomophila]|uniref:Flippase n=2 Tax=Pseudomonas entomophila TaxID=312306 RepID=A0ABY9QLA6_9PSED|nr:flippase [Pseudomonas entomophila]WMW04822.1 flippase [Pseudomonas entomophila]